MTPNEQAPSSSKMVAGFLIRVLADMIDMAILWVFAFGLSFFMENWFTRLGENGVWIGLLVSIAYFVPTQSSFGNGQSLGKRVVGVQVLDMNGQPLSLARSFLRYLVIAFVAYIGVFTGVVNLIAGSSLQLFATSIVGTLWFVAAVGCYLLLPLHPLKRGLHDLIAGSVVVYRGRFNATALASMNNPAKAKKALALVGAISAIVIVIGICAFMAINKNFDMATMQELKTKLEATGKFREVSVNDNTFKNNSGTTHSLIVQAHVDGTFDQTKEDLKPSYDLVFQAIRDQIKDISQYNNLRVGLRLGYNLGIRKRYTTLFLDENPNKPGERKDAGSHTDY